MDIATPYEAESKRQYRNIGTYLDQIVNIFSGSLRLLGWWWVITAFIIGSSLFLAFLVTDLRTHSYLELQAGLHLLFLAAGCVSLIGCFLVNMGRFRNIFDENAWDYVKRHIKVKRRVESQIETIDSLLLQYDLITKKEIELRKKQ